MNILFCFDENYEQHFGVAVTSVILNHPQVSLNIYAIANRFSANLQKKLQQLQALYNVAFHTYTIDDSVVQDLRTSSHISPATYYRLLSPQILPADLDKILYLDADLVVMGSLQELYDRDLTNYLVAARGNRVVTQKKRLSLQGNYYFNAGVLLINLADWRSSRIMEQCLTFLRDYPHIAKFHDQDALNKVIDGQFLNLDPKWNSLVDLYQGNSEQTSESVIVHFVGSLKPWYVWCIAPERELYWSYLKQSPWSKTTPEFPRSFKQLLAAGKSLFKQVRNIRQKRALAELKEN